MNLYTISSQLQFLLDKAAHTELSEEDQKLLEELTVSRSVKLENYAKVVRSIEADVEAYKNEQQDLKRKQIQAERNIEWLKTTALIDLQKHNQKKAKAGIFTWTHISLPSRLQVIDESKVPERFKEKVVEEKILKQQIHEEFVQTGEIFPGTTLQERDSIRLK